MKKRNRVISGLLSFLMVLSVLVGVMPPIEVKAESDVKSSDDNLIISAVKGDYDCNGFVDTTDAISLQKAVLGKTEYDEKAQESCDLNNDGRITAIDLALIAATALGKVTAIPVTDKDLTSNLDGLVLDTTEASVKIKSQLTAVSDDPVYEIGFCYGIQSANENTFVIKQSNSQLSTVSNTKTINNLIPDTTYHGYFYFKRADGIKYSYPIITFFTQKQIVGTVNTTQSTHTATLKATLTHIAGDKFQKIGFSYGVNDPSENSVILNVHNPYYSENSTVEGSITNLVADTTYKGYYFAVRRDGTTIQGDIITFRTPPMVTGTVSGIYDSRVSVKGTVYCEKLDNINQYGFSYGKTNPDENKIIIRSIESKFSSKQPISSTIIRGLEPNTSYIGYLYAQSTDGQIYQSEPLSFTTGYTTVTDTVSNIKHYSASIKMQYEYTQTRDIKEIGIYYGTDSNCENKLEAAHSTSTGSISLKDLSANTTYYYYTYAVTYGGYTYKSEIKTFTTLQDKVEGISFGIYDSYSGEYKYIGTGETATLSFALRDKVKYDYTVVPDYAIKKNITLTSSNPEIVEVTGSYLCANASGTATIIATTEDGGYAASFVITVDDKPWFDSAPTFTGEGLDTDRIQLTFDDLSQYGDYNLIRCHILESKVNSKNPVIVEKDRTVQNGSAIFPKHDRYTQYAIQAALEIRYDDVTHYTPYSDVVIVKTRSWDPDTDDDDYEDEDDIDEPINPTPDPDEPGSDPIEPNPDPVEPDPDPIEPNPDEPGENIDGQYRPIVSGLANGYTVFKGDSLTVTFDIADRLGDVVEKVTVKHNVTGSTAVASLTNSTPGTFTCEFNISDPIFDTVGVYEFCVYARTTNFTVADNLIGKFTVSVFETACQHVSISEFVQKIEYTNIILTGSKHTYYEVIGSYCDDCGADLGTRNSEVKTGKHSVDSNKGCCDCGYMNVSGNTSEEGYNQLAHTRDVYRTPYNTEWHGSIDSGEVVTVLGELNGYYLIEYSIANGGIKQGYVPKHVIAFESQTQPDKPKTTYSLSIDSGYFYEEVSTGDIYRFDGKSNKLFVAERGKFFKVDIIDNSTGNPVYDYTDFKFEFMDDIGVTIDEYGTLCLNLNGNGHFTELELYYDGRYQDSIRIWVCEYLTRVNNLHTMYTGQDSDGKQKWIDGTGLAVNNLCAAANFDYEHRTNYWYFMMDFYNQSVMNFAVASYKPNGEMYDFQLVNGNWRDLSVVDSVTTGIQHTIDFFDGDLFNGTSESDAEKTSVKLKVPEQGYVRVLYSGNSKTVLISNIAELLIGIMDTVDDFKEIFDMKDIGSIRDGIDKEALREELLEILYDDVLSDIADVILNIPNPDKDDITLVIENIQKILCDKDKNLINKIVAAVLRCLNRDRVEQAEEAAKDALKQAENLLLSAFGKPAYMIMNGMEFAGSITQMIGLIKHTSEVMDDDACQAAEFWIWYPKT